MIFWILTGVIVLFWLALVIGNWMDDYVLGLLMLIPGGIVAVLVWFMVAAAVGDSRE